jgi:hypothetical protein
MSIPTDRVSIEEGFFGAILAFYHQIERLDYGFCGKKTLLLSYSAFRIKTKAFTNFKRKISSINSSFRRKRPTVKRKL